ncbi:PoNe immunity protein domain-containing protein [Thauera sinica]|uniref:PoNe immunity protein domain-containing protein n=1 Tax=Thauera sinica TaxID=2665146 RepID=A0ABW1AQE0_9RHOO|nr:PoNe immunity protein domain-containing protein [Thauera sp. K11]ATE59553.1 hypothetical protein CCZ27_05945 [Thauera sp. K11]
MENTKTNFLERRRQPFLTERFYKTWERETFEIARPLRAKRLADPALSQDVRKDSLWFQASETTRLLHLRYTAGEPIEKLRGDLDEVAEEWEAFAKAAGVIGANPAGSIFGFGYRSEYLPAVLLVGLTILLRREDLLPRIDALCFGFHGADAIYEELVAPFVPGRGFVDTGYHAEPYTVALDAIDSDDPNERSALMKEAVESWYASNEGLPFHDTHKDIDEEGYGGYFGYWCFELAALCYLKNIDDSRFRDHLTYPKDLVDFARAYRAEPDRRRPPEPGGGACQVLSARPGEPCPREGVWFASHLVMKEIRMQAGEPMPGPARGASGGVVWYFKAGN